MMQVQQHTASPPNALLLPRNEMAFRERYQQLLLARRITTVFRPGDRIHPNWRGYMLGEKITARIIKRPGSDELGVAPIFNAIRIPIRITGLEVKSIIDLAPRDFNGSSPDVFDGESLIAHLTSIYGKQLGDFGGKVTRIAFEYDN